MKIRSSAHPHQKKEGMPRLFNLLSDDGSVALEFALLFPIVVFMYLATVEVFIYYSYYYNVIKVAQISADFISRQNTLNSGTMSGIFKASAKTMYPLSTTGMTFDVASVIPPQLAPIINWSCAGNATDGETGQSLSKFPQGTVFQLPPTNTPYTLLTRSPSFIVVNVTYPYSALLPVKILGPITSTVYLTPRTQTVLPSPGC